MTRDTAPPLIVITNPVGTTLSQPVIQLQGYSPEALSKVRYDITNAMGLRTNKDGYVTKQWFDTNLFAFTTNWFECLDIQLTNGANLIVLYATDLAGNVRTNTYTYVLDYSGDSSPPSIGISWPQNGAEISGTSFTLRGSVDDATANMVVQMTGTNGVTNVANGLVERNGNFWVENLPLGGGTSSLVITATDAAGNSCVTNISISQSVLVLNIDPLPVDQLNELTITVTGTINSAGYTVWVNDVQATINGNYWSAQNVPVNDGGTAVVHVRAVPNAGMSGSNSAGGQEMDSAESAQAASSQAKEKEDAKDKPVTLLMTQYSKDWSFDMTEDDWLWVRNTQEVHWNSGQPGNDFWDGCWFTLDPSSPEYTWVSDNWDARMYGTTLSGSYRGQDSCGRRDNPDTWHHTISVPRRSETCDGGSFRILTDDDERSLLLCWSSET